MNSGCTAVIAFIIGNMLLCVNLGDSRALLSRQGRVIQLSQDHKPYNPEEKARIEAAGGNVYQDRTQGQLAVSRAFGDFIYKVLYS